MPLRHAGQSPGAGPRPRAPDAVSLSADVEDVSALTLHQQIELQPGRRHASRLRALPPFSRRARVRGRPRSGGHALHSHSLVPSCGLARASRLGQLLVACPPSTIAESGVGMVLAATGRQRNRTARDREPRSKGSPLGCSVRSRSYALSSSARGTPLATGRVGSGRPKGDRQAIFAVVDAKEPSLRLFLGEAPLGLAKADYPSVSKRGGLERRISRSVRRLTDLQVRP